MNNLDNIFECEGLWKVSEDLALFGKLTYDPNGNMRLELNGVNKTIKINRRLELVTGTTTKGDITLLDLTCENTNTTRKTIKLNYTPKVILKGKIFENSKDLKFRKFKFNLFNLRSWLSIKGGELSLVNYDSVKFDYSKPEDFTFNVRNEFKGILSQSINVDEDFRNAKIKLEEFSRIEIVYDEKQDIDVILKHIRIITGFITLLTFEQSYPLSISFYDEDYNDIHNPQLGHLFGLDCYIKRYPYSENYRKRSSNELLVPFTSITDRLGSVLSRWIELEKEITPVVYLLLGAFRDKRNFNVNDFMDIVRALESFHRMTFPEEKKFSDEIFKEILGNIKKSLEVPEQREWIMSRVRFANEISLKQRLEGLVKKYLNNSFEKDIESHSKFIKRIVDTRNYYTHFDANSGNPILDGQELYDNYKVLIKILISCILKELGFKNDDFEERLEFLSS